MSLADHLRELRYRLVFSLIAITVGVIVCAFFYFPLLDFLVQPYLTAKEILEGTRPQLDLQAALSGVAAPIVLALMVVAVGGLVITSPIWLYQLWAYIAPALLAKEKKYALAFLAAAVPLFLGGIVLAYVIMPQAVAVMVSFTPGLDILNIINLDDFLKLMMQLMLVFGVGFLLPVVVVTLNFVGLVKATALKSARRYVLFGCAVFGAAATPGGDPISMLALALPMMGLFLIAESICRANDRRRARKAGTDLVSA
ncbi:MAG: twin-arginine translocase subunit TatC [Propioniciclava sp.]|uniref:twin-arginine translocase subunit TatC n=1 Tax=Propioniciclava sp. TaxID=2038686 RepID=UPI0039E2FDA4